MFFDSGYALWRVVVVGVCAYLALVALLRVSGKRTLSKMNAFDLVVTVALGSTLATILLSKDVALLEGITAFVLLIAMQFVIAWLSVRSAAVQRLVKSEPTLLFYRGDFLHSVMLKERVTEDEVRAAVRSQGMAAVADVEAVVLETDGTFTVIPASDSAATALIGVRHALPDDERTGR
jgi:uncharacterized membrane protein YcaP (DUF421 family)